MYPFTCWHLSCFRHYYEWNCYQYSCTSLFSKQEWTCGLYGKCPFNFVRNCQTAFQNGYTILPSQNMSSNFSTTSPTLRKLAFKNCNHSGECVVVNYYTFSFHFPDDWYKFIFSCTYCLCVLFCKDLFKSSLILKLVVCLLINKLW